MFKFRYVLEIPIVRDFPSGFSPNLLDRIEVRRVGRKAQHLHPLPYVGIPRFLLVPQVVVLFAQNFALQLLP